MHQTYVFDAYGTLFDVHAAVRKYAHKVGPDSVALSEMWRAKQLEYTWTRTMMNRYVDFWDLTRQALDYAFAKFPDADEDFRDDLLDAYWELDCFTEVPDVLRALKDKGANTAILSNGSPEMLEAAVASSNLDGLLDAVISVDSIRQFKTVPSVYQLAVERFGGEPSDVSFQSSNRWDVAGAHVFGFKTVWCNRANMPDEYTDCPADKVVSDLRELLD